jgi:serine/threonine protein kinase
VKSISKQDAIQTDHVGHLRNERRLLENLEHPFLVKLLCSFSNEKRVFFVLPFLQGGDLFNHLKREIRFKEERAKFYAA